MSISRRSFFAKVAGTAVATQVAPSFVAGACEPLTNLTTRVFVG
jgi:hypothetical protein